MHARVLVCVGAAASGSVRGDPAYSACNSESSRDPRQKGVRTPMVAHHRAAVAAAYLSKLLALGPALCLLILLSCCTPRISAPRPARPSAGCGSAPPASPGETAELSITDAKAGVQRSFYMHVPTDYNASQPTALILAFHGWNGDGQALVNQMTPQADDSNFVVVGPNGLAENLYRSWNGGGTTQVPFPGPRGPTCDASRADTYCYTSCGARSEGCHPCDWTTCNDDIAFTATLLDWLEVHFCVDLTKVFAVGFSNGATFTYAVSAALSARISAFVANSGTPHPGFEQAPANVQRALDIHGVNDDTCPADYASPGLGGSPPGQPSSDGWYYLDVSSTLKLWVDVLRDAQTNAGCPGLEPPVDPSSPPTYPTSVDGDRGLSCVRLSSGGCSNDEDLNQTQIVRCSFVGGHEVHASMPRIAWEFFSGETEHSCADNDFCLQRRPGWGSSYHCETSVEYCTGSYASDMTACCPEACGLCPPAPLPPPPPPPAHAGTGTAFPTAAVLGGLGAYIGLAVGGILFCACCTTAAVKRDAIRASLARSRIGGSLTRERSDSKEQPMMPTHSSC